MVVDQEFVNSAYDNLSKDYNTISKRRSCYIESVNSLVAQYIVGSSLLDIGSGDGSRLPFLQNMSSISNITCMEPSIEMYKLLSMNSSVFTINSPAQLYIPKFKNSFESVTMLWNVAGHIPTERDLQQSFSNVYSYLKPGGRLILDCHNRHNASQYGYFLIFYRVLLDFLNFNRTRGDVSSTYVNDNVSVSSYGHLFTPHELMHLLVSANFSIVTHNFVNYDTGSISRLFTQGHHFVVATKQN